MPREICGMCQRFFIKYICCFCLEYPKNQIIYNYEKIEEMDDAFDVLEAQASESFLKKYLTREVFNDIKFRQTHAGTTLLDIIASGIKNPDSIFGVYAPDPECYRVFPELMYPILCAAHFLPHIITHPSNIRYGSLDYIDVLDMEGRYIKAVTFELSRNLRSYKFIPSMTKADLHESQAFLSAHFQTFRNENFRGRYIGLKGMEPHVKKSLTRLRLMFPEEDKWLDDGGGRNYWPSGRGIFLPDAMDFAIWVNVEDHIKVVVPNFSGEFKKCYERMIQIHKMLHKYFTYHVDQDLGYLNVCPSNVGTGLHAEIELELPILQKYPDAIQKVCNDYCLSGHGHGGFHSEASQQETFFLRTTRSLGVDEYNSILPVYEGVLELLVAEQRLSKELRNQAMGMGHELKLDSGLRMNSVIQIAKRDLKHKTKKVQLNLPLRK